MYLPLSRKHRCPVNESMSWPGVESLSSMLPQEGFCKTLQVAQPAPPKIHSSWGNRGAEFLHCTSCQCPPVHRLGWHGSQMDHGSTWVMGSRRTGKECCRSHENSALQLPAESSEALWEMVQSKSIGYHLRQGIRGRCWWVGDKNNRIICVHRHHPVVFCPVNEEMWSAVGQELCWPTVPNAKVLCKYHARQPSATWGVELAKTWCFPLSEAKPRPSRNFAGDDKQQLTWCRLHRGYLVVVLSHIFP